MLLLCFLYGSSVLPFCFRYALFYCFLPASPISFNLYFWTVYEQERHGRKSAMRERNTCRATCQSNNARGGCPPAHFLPSLSRFLHCAPFPHRLLPLLEESFLQAVSRAFARRSSVPFGNWPSQVLEKEKRNSSSAEQSALSCTPRKGTSQERLERKREKQLCPFYTAGLFPTEDSNLFFFLSLFMLNTASGKEALGLARCCFITSEPGHLDDSR